MIDHCLFHNTNLKSFSESKDHDPDYDWFISEDFIINFDETRTPIKILRDTDSLQSLITTNCAMACDCLDTSDERLIRGIIRQVNKIPGKSKFEFETSKRFGDHWNTRRYTCWL